MADGDQLWIDGKLVANARNLSFHPDAVIDTDSDTWRPRSLSVVRERPRGVTLRSPYRLQVRFETGPHTYLSLHCKCLQRRKLMTHQGLFFELRSRPHPPCELLQRSTSEIVLALDGLVILDPIIEAVLERAPKPGRGPWVTSVLRLRLAPGHAPSRWLSRLCQRRPARRLLIRIGSQTLALEELGTLAACMIASPELAWTGPASAGIELEFVLESRPPVELARAPELECLPVELRAIHDPKLEPRRRERLLADLRTLLSKGEIRGRQSRAWVLADPLPSSARTWADRIPMHPPQRPNTLELVAFTSDASVDLAAATASFEQGAELWRQAEPALVDTELSVRVAPLDEVLPTLAAFDAAAGVRTPERDRFGLALARAHGDAIVRATAESLDREGLAHEEAWAVFADHLQQRGDPRGELLAALRLAEHPRELEPAILATLDPQERQLRATPPGGQLRFDEREWSPRIWATWVGPMIVHLAIIPDWTRVVDDDGLYAQERMLELGGLGPTPPFFARERQQAGQLFGLRTWQSVPGYDPRAEVERLLELPCCALLSPRRILQAGPQGVDQRVSALNFAGADLRGIELRDTAMHNCSFRGANLDGAKLTRMTFVQCDLRGLSWQAARLEQIESKDVLADPELAARLAEVRRPNQDIFAISNPAFDEIDDWFN